LLVELAWYPHIVHAVTGFDPILWQPVRLEHRPSDTERGIRMPDEAGREVLDDLDEPFARRLSAKLCKPPLLLLREVRLRLAPGDRTCGHTHACLLQGEQEASALLSIPARMVE